MVLTCPALDGFHNCHDNELSMTNSVEKQIERVEIFPCAVVLQHRYLRFRPLILGSGIAVFGRDNVAGASGEREGVADHMDVWRATRRRQRKAGSGEQSLTGCLIEVGYVDVQRCVVGCEYDGGKGKSNTQ